MEGWTSEVSAGVERRLSAFFDEERARVTQLAPQAEVLHGAIAALTMRGGKRLRPAVLYAAYRAVRPDGGFGEVADACAGLEVLQTYLLIHDDWMDGDETRRGGPSVHAALRDRFDPALADRLAILAGNLACAWSWRLFGAGEAVRDVVLRMHEEVLVGQQLDLMAVEDVSRMHRLKTGSYTLRGPIALGAVLGGASAAQREALDAFAAPLGEAFQLRDDLLGTFGDPRDTGKSAGNDLCAGKRTALVLAAERSGADLRELRAVFGVLDAPAPAIAAARALLERSGARRAVETRLDALLAEADAALARAPLAESGRAMLAELAARLAHRAH
ncbi:MAG: polyprenyl synthetase family protein [Sandaracinaceae bacterium]|nr:polyprenyl synthetase family protein [Sandaracinaceae bacterium]